ncbi:MAG TPA: selenium cofactor biosynthesis protein YqeC [Candidatus Sulfomarinibacteraceae bacterium]|nr:selenium cofactor biosynthesis protein YqeC [Candidatus Sulfomarinibacteraceae bacterium]
MTDSVTARNHSQPHAHSLCDALNLNPAGELVALVGGGGKTSLLFALARELAAAGRRVVGATTTRMASAEVTGAPSHCLLDDLEQLSVLLQQHHFCVVVGGVGPEKAKNVPLALPGQLLARPDVDYVLVEADGAKMLPVKAPDDHEPAIPPDATLVLTVVGVDALDGPISRVAHRPHLVCTLTGRTPDQRLRPQDVALLLAHPDAGLKNAPSGARLIGFVNKVETKAQLAQAQRIAALALQSGRLERVLLGAAHHEHPVRRIVREPGSSGP